MINFFSNFASSLIASIILITIIEMFLPDGKNKKYVTFVATIVLSIVIINPIIKLLNEDINIETYLTDETKTFLDNEYTLKMEYAKQKNIDELYYKYLQEDIIRRLEENGYEVKNIFIDIDRNSYEPQKIEMEISHSGGGVQKVIIDVSNSDLNDDISLFEIAKIKDILYSNYNVNRKNIIINNK